VLNKALTDLKKEVLRFEHQTSALVHKPKTPVLIKKHQSARVELCQNDNNFLPFVLLPLFNDKEFVSPVHISSSFKNHILGLRNSSQFVQVEVVLNYLQKGVKKIRTNFFDCSDLIQHELTSEGKARLSSLLPTPSHLFSRKSLLLPEEDSSY
jgi:hypothetical protein